jgi:hypothetical protein
VTSGHRPEFFIEKLRRDYELLCPGGGSGPQAREPERIAKGLARHPIGVVLLARQFACAVG